MTEFLDFSKGMFNQPGFLDLSAKGINLYQPQGNRYNGYSFYVDFTDGIGRDRVSKTLMETTLSAGRVNADGTALGVNVPAIQGGKLNSYGPIGQLVPYSELTSSWTGSGPWTQVINLAATGTYTLSTGLAGATVTVTAGTATIDAPASATFGTPDQFVVSAIGTITISTNTANPKAQITLSAYKLPYVVNTTSGPTTTPHGYSDSDEGYKWDFAKCPKLFDSLDGAPAMVGLLDPALFNSMAGWAVVTDMSIASGSVTCVAATGVTSHTTALTLAAYYLVSYTISNYTTGYVRVRAGYADIGSVDSSGNKTVEQRVLCGGNTSLYIAMSAGFSGTISNISVKAVSPAQATLEVDWTPQFSAANVPLMPDIPRTLTVQTGTPTITGSTIEFKNEASSVQQLNYWIIGKTYRIVCTVTNYVGTGGINLPYDGTWLVSQVSSNGVYTFDYTPDNSTSMVVYSYAGHTATVTINSIQEIPQLNILSANGNFKTPLYYEPVDQLIKLTDGTNTTSVAYTAVADTPCAIKIKYGPHPGYANAPKMQVSCGAVDGAITTFDGSFNPVTALATGWDSVTDVWQQLSRIAVKEANPWIV